MLKIMKVDTYIPTEEDVVFQELADQIDANLALGKRFYDEFVPNPKQQELYDLIENSEVPPGEWLHVLVYGSTGSGKTFGVLSWIVRELLRYPGAGALGVRRTFTELDDTLYGDLYKKVLDRFEIKYTKNDQRMLITLPNSSFFRFRSNNSLVSSVTKDKADGLGGTAYSIAMLEEADSISEELAQTIPGRMRQASGVRRKVIFYLCNPPSKSHWLYKWFFKGNDPTDLKSPYRVIKIPVQDNEKHVGSGYIRGIERDYGRNPSLRKRLVDGDFGPDMKGIPIFADSFRREIHVSGKNISLNWNKEVPLIRGWDFGYHHPAIVVFQDDPDTGQIRVFRAIVGEKTLLDSFADRWLSRLEEDFPDAEWKDFVDPAGAQVSDKSALTSIDTLRAKGVFPRWRKENIAYGLSILEEQLKQLYKGEPALLIDPQCEALIEALEVGYCNDKEAMDYEIKPVKDGIYDHIVDAFRYALIHIRRPGKGRQSRWSKDGGGRSEWTPLGAPEKLVTSRDPMGFTRQPQRVTVNRASYNFGKQRRY